MNTDKSRLQEFLYGFARGADIDLSEASAQWAGYSVQLSDDKRRLIESQGEDSGFSEGQAFAKLYPPIESDPEAMAAIELLKSRGLAAQACELLRDGVEISLDRLENVESSNPHFMFLGRHGELFATVKMHDMSVPEFRIVSHEDECTGETERWPRIQPQHVASILRGVSPPIRGALRRNHDYPMVVICSLNMIQDIPALLKLSILITGTVLGGGLVGWWATRFIR